MEVMAASQTVISDVSMGWEARLRAIFDGSFKRYVRVVHGAPTRERIGGKLPLVAVHLFDLRLADYAQIIRRPETGGKQRGLQLDYMLSAWAEEAVDEQLLLDHIRYDLDARRTLELGSAKNNGWSYPVLPKPSLKLENAISFWSAMGSPLKAALQYAVNVTSTGATRG